MILRLLAVFALLFSPLPVMAQDGEAAITETVAPAPTTLAPEPATGTTAAPATGDTIAREAFIIDYDTGTVLMDKNGDARMPTSSMSKVMTILMAFDGLKNGKLTLDQKFPVSEKAWRMQGSKMFVELGSAIAIEDLIRGIIIQSGNDATVVMAEGIAGSEEEFASLMNAKAADMGMTSSHFVNASGWPDPEHYSTAHDLAILAIHTIRDYPDHYKYYAEKEFTWHNIHQMNRNPLLFRDLGVDGLKTGHAEEAGYGLIASGLRDNRRVVMVLNGLSDEKARAQEGARLMEWALRSFENVKLFAAGDTVDQAKVVMGQAAEVPMVTEDDVIMTLPKAVKNDLKVTVSYMEPLVAPVKKGDQIGTLKIDIPRVGVVEKKLLAGADVPKLGLIAATMAKAKMMIGAR